MLYRTNESSCLMQWECILLLQPILFSNTWANCSSDPPATRNVAPYGFITLRSSTERNCIQSRTGKEKIKPTERALLKQCSQHKTPNKTELLYVHSKLQLFTIPRHLYPIIQKDLANVQTEWYGCLLLWEETKRIKLISFSDRHLWFFTGFTN